MRLLRIVTWNRILQSLRVATSSTIAFKILVSSSSTSVILRRFVSDDLAFQFDNVARFWSWRHRHLSMLRRSSWRLVRWQGCFAWTVNLLILIVVIGNLMNKVAYASILHFDLLNFLLLVTVCSSTRSSIRLIQLALRFSVVTLDGRGSCSRLPARFIHSIFLTLLLLHWHYHILVKIQLLHRFLIKWLLNIVLEVARVLLLQNGHAILWWQVVDFTLLAIVWI